MSFSHDVKTEISQLENKECCQKAESYGLFLFGRSFSAYNISILTEHKGVCQKYAQAVHELSGKNADIKVSKSEKYTVSIDSQKEKDAILSFFGHDSKDVGVRINYANFSEECCMSAFLRGVFMACGTVSAPEKDYHLEFSIPYKNLCSDFMKFFDEFDYLEPKMTSRNGVNIVYFKDSEMIENLLITIGANNSTIELINVKIMKNIRNNVNRKVNFDSANIDRAVKAALHQIEAIEKIIKKGSIDFLPQDMRELALLRMENPEMSLSELGQSLKKPISRSGVYHRLNKIIEISKKI